jgi:ubiquinone/menaquinone biosynthesis C-methylase UbiE
MIIRRTSRGDRLPSDWGFRLMSLESRLRDLLHPRKAILQEAEIKPGFRVLDYGCGPGSYVVTAAGLVGTAGKVYALDAHPLAIRNVERLIAAKRLANVQVIFSECETGLSDCSLDVVLLYDIIHDLADPDCVLSEIRRTLKPGGRLSLRDHQLGREEIVSKTTARGLFRLSGKGRSTLLFTRL